MNPFTAMRKLLRKIFLFLIPLFILAFNFQDNVGSGWYFQSLPNLNGANLTDMTFTDSLTGYAVTKLDSFGNGYILKTTNGGDNWNIIFQNTIGFTKVHFLNNHVGFAASLRLMKTTNGGDNWFESSPLPSNAGVVDMSIVDENEIWATNPVIFDGGLSRSTNGGLNWTRMFTGEFSNPSKIYMYNSRLGFMYYGSKTYRTTNSGAIWDSIPGQFSDEFIEMKFADSLTGWKARSILKKTTDGGLTWQVQQIPGTKESPGVIISFSIISKDTLWGCGGYEYISNTNYHARVYKTTNGGMNWGYQTPAPQLNTGGTYLLRFSGKNHGWTYFINGAGFHTKIGGNDTTIYVGINQISYEIPQDYKLYQNYPNPFNPNTVISYQLQFPSFVSLRIYNINGKNIATLVNQNQPIGIFTVDFNSQIYNLSSGIYFYKLEVNNSKTNFTQTKKMILMK